MKFHKLRIAFAALCGLAAVLLVVLWVRSYWWSDTVFGPILGTHFLLAKSEYGRLQTYIDDRSHLSTNEVHWAVGHCSIAQIEKEDEQLRRSSERRHVIINPSARPIFGSRF